MYRTYLNLTRSHASIEICFRCCIWPIFSKLLIRLKFRSRFTQKTWFKKMVDWSIWEQGSSLLRQGLKWILPSFKCRSNIPWMLNLTCIFTKTKRIKMSNKSIMDSTLYVYSWLLWHLYVHNLLMFLWLYGTIQYGMIVDTMKY